MRTPDEIVQDVRKYLDTFGPPKFPTEQTLADMLMAELLALYESEQAATQALREALKLAEIWLVNCVPTVDLPGPKPLPVIRAALAKESSR